MIDRWIKWLNYAIIGVMVLMVLGMAAMWIGHSGEIACLDPKSKQCPLPKGAFELSQSAYEGIASPFFELKSAPPTLQIPDLRQQIGYNGRNGRPDAQAQHSLMHFSMNGSAKKVISVVPNEPYYLVMDRTVKPSRYIFSPGNQKTSLWFEASPTEGNEVMVRVFMEDENGERIVEPEAHAQFKIPERDYVRPAGETWELGPWRVDGTLLARQRARWFGQDRFIEKHGGKKYEHAFGRQRVEFGETDETYFVFVQTGDVLIWDEGKKQWREVVAGESTLEYPLLVVKKIDDRVMSLEVWDVDGKGKVALNLLKSNESWTANNGQYVQQAFKFVGARTRKQCLFEINGERMLIKPSDWLLMTLDGWKKLEKAEEIDDYVLRKKLGLLFVFEELTRRKDKQLMVGTLYNPTRSDCQTVELMVQQVNPKASSKKSGSDDDDDDDDDDSDEAIEKMISSIKAKDQRIPPKSAPNLPSRTTLPAGNQNQTVKR